MRSEPDTRALLDIRAGVTLTAAITLLVLPAANWRSLSPDSAFGGVLSVFGVIAAMSCIVLALVVRTDAIRVHLDRVIFGVAAVWYVLSRYAYFRSSYVTTTGVDETFLGQRALRLLAAGHNPYVANFPGVAHLPGPTFLLNGGFATHYDYPPLTLELGWVLRSFWTPLGEPWVLTALAVVATAAIAFFAVPESWRVLVVPAVFGLGMLDGFVALGFPAIVALPFLCVVARNWTSTGTSGRLGRSGIVQAVCLGLAATAHQLAWFMAVFVVVALWSVRRGELSPGKTAAVLARYVAIAVLVFLILDAPFIASHPHAWFNRVTDVMTQRAIPFGTGWVLIMNAASGQTANLAYFTYATVLAFVALLAITTVGIRRLALAVPVLPSVMFLFSARSNLLYLVFFVPLLLVWAATADRAAIERCQPVRWVPWHLLSSAPRRAVAAVAVLVPALVFVGLAVLSPGPLAITPQHAVLTDGRLTEVVVDVSNRSDHDVRPRFTVNGRTQIEPRWRIVGGPVTLRPGQHATLTLRPGWPVSAVQKPQLIYAVSTDPGTLSSASLTLPASQIQAEPGTAGATSGGAQQCAVRVLTGARDCGP